VLLARYLAALACRCTLARNQVLVRGCGARLEGVARAKVAAGVSVRGHIRAVLEPVARHCLRTQFAPVT
jgi:hypothetical protein